MLEFMDLLLLGLSSTVISAIVCVVCAVVMQTIRNRDVEDLYRKMESLEMTVRGAAGRESRADRTAKLEAAMLEAAQIMQDPKIEDKKGAIIALAAKYPDVALHLGKKYMGL